MLYHKGNIVFITSMCYIYSIQGKQNLRIEGLYQSDFRSKKLLPHELNVSKKNLDIASFDQRTCLYTL